MPSTTYPMLRRKRSRRFRVPAALKSIRVLALALLALFVVGAGLTLSMRRDPPNARQSLIDALATLRAGNYSAARNNAQAAIAAAPTLGMPHAILARAYLELGDGLAAEAELGRARDAGFPANRLYQLQAQARFLQGDPGGAIDAADKAAPRYVDYALRVRARAMAIGGDTAAARDLLQGLLARRPDYAAAWTDLGRIAFASGDVGGASDAATHALALAPAEPAALTLQGEVIRSRYGLVAALPWFEKALATDAYYHPALIEYAATLGEAGRYADMLAATRKAQAARPGSPQALYLQAVLAARAGRPELARSLLQKTGGAIDALPGAILLSGSLDFAEGKYEQAAAMWRGLVNQQPMNVTARRLLGAALLRSGDPRAALDMLRPIGLRADADGYALGVIARAFEAIGDTGFAARYRDRANAGTLGAAATFATDNDVGTLEASAAETPDDPNYVLGAIRGLIESGDTAGAIARARTLAAASPGAPAAQLALGDALAASGDYRGAATVYARAADLAFDEPTMLRLVDALGRTDRTKDAAATLALYLSQNPQSLSARRLLGHWQVASGDFDAAIDTLEAVRARAGNRNASLLTDLALAYAGADQGDVAVRYARAAYALAPMNADVCDAYGVALAAGGDKDGARQLLVKATKLAPANTAIAAHLKQLG